MTVKLHKDPAIIAHADQVLGDLAETSKSLTYATFLTDDGFEVTRLRSDFSANNRIAAMRVRCRRWAMPWRATSRSAPAAT
ncbi:hypothetical protein H7F51_10765 [Novosphingobium flavum]|uniref:Uncharacterized protein n=1 Tax=Novosphingobium flavum TaxID=1778672 RepID=A0A7X1FSG2_9SPHN|nr:hypothetical protein [Novosphingobium flavum]MBC2666009.1 hypothetical protein [Novosphingobium flavum]